MPRRPRYCTDHFYHFYNRGAHGHSLFREPDNYLFILRKIKHYASQFDLTIIAYCLLPNHYHLLVRQDGQDPAGLLPQRVFNSYSKAYNKRYDHSGTLFQGAYRVSPVTQESHLLHLCRYIHANPVIHGVVPEVTGWPYSNYLEWIGERPGTLVDLAFVRHYFPTATQYRQFVHEYIVDHQLPPALERDLERLEQ